MTTELPTPKAIFDQYLADNATDKKGKKYVFDSDGEPDHFKLLECVLGDIEARSRPHGGCGPEDEKFAAEIAEIDEIVNEAEDIYLAQFEVRVQDGLRPWRRR